MYKYDYELEFKANKNLEEKIRLGAANESEIKKYKKNEAVKGKANLIKSDLSQLYEGMIIKNYKEFCALLGEKPATGSSKICQLKRWKNRLDFIKEEGKKSFVIKKIYDQQKEEETKYFSYFRQVLLSFLNQCNIEFKDQIDSENILEIGINRKRFFKDMGFWSDDFADGKNEIFLVTQFLNNSSTNEINSHPVLNKATKDSEYYANIINKWNNIVKENWNIFVASGEGHNKAGSSILNGKYNDKGKIKQPDLFYIEKNFFNDVETKCVQILNSCMKNFIELFDNPNSTSENKKIIRYYDPTAIRIVTFDPNQQKRKVARFATQEEQEKIEKIENDILKKLKCTSEYHAQIRGLHQQFHKMVKDQIIKSEMIPNYSYHFKAIRIKFFVSEVQKQLQKLIVSYAKSNLENCFVNLNMSIEEELEINNNMTLYFYNSYYKKAANNMNIVILRHIIESCTNRAIELLKENSDENIISIAKGENESVRNYMIRKANANLNYLNKLDDPEQLDNSDFGVVFNSYSKLSPRENAIMYLKRTIELTMNYVLRSNNEEAKEIFKDYIECDENKVFLELLNSVGNKKNKKKE